MYKYILSSYRESLNAQPGVYRAPYPEGEKRTSLMHLFLVGEFFYFFIYLDHLLIIHNLFSCYKYGSAIFFGFVQN